MKGLTYGLAALVVSASAVSALSLLVIDAGQTSTNQQVEVEEVAKKGQRDRTCQYRRPEYPHCHV